MTAFLLITLAFVLNLYGATQKPTLNGLTLNVANFRTGIQLTRTANFVLGV